MFRSKNKKHRGRSSYAMLRMVLALLVALTGTLIMGGAASTASATGKPKDKGKVFVCKYVGKPGVDERLKEGKNPISVSVSSIRDYKGPGSYFADAQGRSFVLAEDKGQPTPGVSECPTPEGPPEEPVEPEGVNNSSSPKCETIMVGTPSGVKPEGASVVVKLDGTIVEPGTYPATVGDHVVETFVNGKLVDSDTVSVSECEAPEEPKYYLETSHVEKCGEITITLRNVSPWIYAVSYTTDGGNPDANGPNYGPVVDNRGDAPDVQIDSITLRFLEDQDDGEIPIKYVVAAGTEADLYRGKPVGEITTVLVKTDCEPNEQPEPAKPSVNVSSEACVKPGETTAASGVITNTDDETDEAVSYDWSVTLTGDDAVVDSGTVQDVADGATAPFSPEVSSGDYTVTITGSDGTTASTTFTVTECETPPGEEAPNTFEVFAGDCDDYSSSGSIFAGYSNTAEDTDASTELSVQLRDMLGNLASGPHSLGSVADGDSSELYQFTGLVGGLNYTVEFLDGETVVNSQTVYVELCDVGPPTEEGDVDVVPGCGFVTVTNREKVDGQFFHGSFDELEPDGVVPVKAGETVKVPTERSSLDWVVYWDDGKFSEGENLRVKQVCGGNQPPSTPNPTPPNTQPWPTPPAGPVSNTPRTANTGMSSESSPNWGLLSMGLLTGMAGFALVIGARRRGES